MRLAGVAALIVLLAAPALAQTPQRPAAPAPKPNPGTAPRPQNPLAASYAAMSEADRIAIQNDLIWTGDYNGLATAGFGARPIAAVKAFQKRLGVKETGVLNPKERQQLGAAARAKREAVGWTIVNDQASGARVAIPAKLVPQTTPIAAGTRWQSANGGAVVETFRITAPDTTLASVYEAQRKVPDSKVSYNVIRGDMFVVSGLRGLKKFYVRGQSRGGEVRGFSIQYDQALEGSLDVAVIAMSSMFQAFPAGAAVAVGPAPRRKIEYGSGAFVDAAGHVITSRDLIEGCQTYTIAGHGPADKVAENKESGLALLRIYGVRDLNALTLADGGATNGTLVGVADPERQAGAGAVSATPVRLTANGSKTIIEPTPALGFAGAPVIDVTGRLTGITEVSSVVVAGPSAPSATLIPASAVKALLAQQKVAPAATATQDARTAVVRIICVRK